ncbi:DUF6612 family protein [Paenibacillus sp. FSL R5-0527]|uniref:DUF6612 family protein n=1 Tax=Paenibacillus TaxID=44249 RepID=UPI00097A589F|nr:hypothetical protein [Paenibacillus macerans]OMG47086.1 hypothetical protein BK140_23585 [Paenibacillus macerans]
MKKWVTVLLTAILAVSLTACGGEKAAKGGNAEGGAQTPATAETSGNTGAVPTVDELIQKTTEASKGLKSFSMDASVNQNIVVTAGEQKQEQKVDMKMKIDTTKEPLAMYNETQMSIPDSGEQKFEQYVTEEGIFTNATGTWTKLPDDQRDQILASMGQSANLEKQLEQFKAIAGETKVSEEGGEYILAADVSGDSVKELAKTLMSQSGGENEQMAAMLDQMNIKGIKITYGINKETYLPTKTNVEMTMEMSQDGQSVSLEMKMDSTISKHNEVSEIKVPQEVLDSAV